MSTGNLSSFPENLKKKALLSINEKEIFVDEFLAYAKGKNQSVIDLFSDFKDQQIIDYYKDNLEKSEPEYAKTLKEYKEGLLLFELMQHKVWDKSAKDTLGLNEYYGTHQKKYEGKPLKAIRGRVMNDYKNYLDSTWVSDLRKNSDIKIDKKQLKKLVTFYKKD
jgi:peptidyl-prolyl cis-trans isomerase SurA